MSEIFQTISLMWASHVPFSHILETYYVHALILLRVYITRIILIFSLTHFTMDTILWI